MNTVWIFWYCYENPRSSVKDHCSDFFRRLIHKVREVHAETHTYKFEVNITIHLGVGEHCLDFLGIVMKVRQVR